MLAGKEGLLEQYKNGEIKTHELITSLKSTVSDNPAQVARLQAVETVLNAEALLGEVWIWKQACVATCLQGQKALERHMILALNGLV